MTMPIREPMLVILITSLGSVTVTCWETSVSLGVPIVVGTYISPHCAMMTSKSGTSRPRRPVLVASIFLTTSMPSTTLPKTTCLPSRNGVGTVVMKNWEPLVLGPAFCE